MSSALLALIARQRAKTNFAKTTKPPANRSRWKILPSWRNIANAPAGLSDEDKAVWAMQFWHDFGQHWIKDAAGQIKAVALCVDKTFGRTCAVCGEIERGIMSSQDDVTTKRLKDAKASGRVLFNAMHLDGPTPNEVVILEVPPSVLNGKKGAGGLLGKMVDWPNLFDLANGADVIIEKVGSGMDTSYDVSIVPCQPGFVINPTVLTKLHNLDQYVAQESNEANQRALAGVSSITGLLPAPSAAGGTSLASLASSMPAAAQVFTDIPDLTPTQQPVQQTMAVQQPIPAAQPIVQQPVQQPVAQAAPWDAAQPAAQPVAQAAPVQQPAPVATSAAGPSDMSALEAMLQGLG